MYALIHNDNENDGCNIIMICMILMIMIILHSLFMFLYILMNGETITVYLNLHPEFTHYAT